MLKSLLFFFCSLVLFLQSPRSQVALHIVPQPVSIQMQEGSFSLSKDISIEFSDQNKKLKQIAQLALEHFSAYGPNIRLHGKHAQSIVFTIDKALPFTGNEAYRLLVTPLKITISANNERGIFYGLQTLFQTVTPQQTVPCLEITDYPQFAWRGFMLDVSRHFFSVQEIKKILDVLAMYKMNVFHWHLCDDQGWRLEIKKYPRLTAVGAWRTEVPGAIYFDKHNDTLSGKPYNYGGFYTQEQAREIVAYAKDRNITVLPEIEMPGHSEAALAAYPEYSCSQKQQPVANSMGFPPGAQSEYNPGNAGTFTFLENILKEVMDIFPSEYIHIGGDEVDKTNWRNSVACQALMKNEGLKNESELQSYFINRIAEFLHKHHRELIGWDEILEGNLAPSATVMYWRSYAKNAPLKAVTGGHSFINVSADPLYFNRYQADPKTEPLAAPHSLNTLKKVYDFSVIPENFTIQQRSLVKGGQGAIWTEFFGTGAQIEYMLLPRLLALSENLWTPASEKDYSRFYNKLPAQLDILNKMNYHFRKPDKRK